MELLERDENLQTLRERFQSLETGEGSCVFVSGEAGIGKSSLLRSFCRSLHSKHRLLTGSCDALFSPRPLGPVYDILYQLKAESWETNTGPEQRRLLFNQVFNALDAVAAPMLLLFEDVHWADEASLDFIRFLARRINQLRCLFVLTYRDNEIGPQHPLRQVIAQVPPAFIKRIQLEPLSRATVLRLANANGYDGARVYNLSGGNPFYVTEILAGATQELPPTLKDTVLEVYFRQDELTRSFWALLSVLPSGLETALLETIDARFSKPIEEGLHSRVLVERGGQIIFKHELYRIAIEESLTAALRTKLNRTILDHFTVHFLQLQQLERIVHHAALALDDSLVLQYAPLAAKKAASVGAHTEAAKLYHTAIGVCGDHQPGLLVQLYEAYAYECYLTSNIALAIEYTEKAKQLWESAGEREQTGNSMRFLSRLWWFYGNGSNALTFATEAIQQLQDLPGGRAKALAYSNMSQLKMLAGDTAACVHWGEQAIQIALDLGEPEILSHAKNNIGAVLMKHPASYDKGLSLLQESLQIALQYSFHEHAARAFTNLVTGLVLVRQYKVADQYLEDGIRYCEDRDLDSWTIYMSSWKARHRMETGRWNDALQVADFLLKHPKISVISLVGTIAIDAAIRLRQGEQVDWERLEHSKQQAFATKEAQRVVPVMIIYLEAEWITGERRYTEEELQIATKIITALEAAPESNEFVFWLWLARQQSIPTLPPDEAYDVQTEQAAAKAATLWSKNGFGYYEAICRFLAGEGEALKALDIFRQLGAKAVAEKIKKELRAAGIKKIPRGAQKKTASNAAGLTARELDILKLIQAGLQNKEIAAKLFLSAKTIDNHITSILSKLDVNSRVKAVQRAQAMSIL